MQKSYERSGNEQNIKEEGSIKNNENSQKIDGQKLTVSQVKQQILKYAPDMADQMDVFNDQQLYDIYYSVVSSKQTTNKPQQSKENSANHEFQQSKQNQLQSSRIRSSQIQKIIDQIAQSVPNFKNQSITFEDDQIKELYQSIYQTQQHKTNVQKTISPPKVQQPQQISLQEKSSTTKGKKTNYGGVSRKQVRNFMYNHHPEMLEELRLLSDEDLFEVYQQFTEKQKSIANNPPAPGSFTQNFNQYSPRQPPKQNLNGGRMAFYDPLKKFETKKNQNGNSSKGQQINQIRQGQQDSLQWFNTQKYGNKGLNDSRVVPNPYLNGSNDPIKSNINQFNLNAGGPVQIHNFHNNHRVNYTPIPSSNTSRTFIIVHTMQNGYIPVTHRISCKCDCCRRRQNQMNDPNALSSFINELIFKYSRKK